MSAVSNQPKSIPIAEEPMQSCAYNVHAVRADFPALHQEIHGKPLVYLDNAATAQRPLSVIEAIDRFYRVDNANVHRGVHTLSERASSTYEAVREKVRRFINAPETSEVIFLRGATEALNLVAQTHGRSNIGEGDEILISGMEHHSNIVPWQMLCQEKGAKLRHIPLNDAGELDLSNLDELLNEKTKILAINHISNALGTINPVKEITVKAHAVGAIVVCDGAQAAAHMTIDVQDLDVDFYTFSAHKMYGPTGIGVLWGRKNLLAAMPPWMGGGDMIRTVSFNKTVYADPPLKFEAGTPNISGVIGFGAAIDYLDHLCLKNIAAHEHDLLLYGTEKLKEIPGLRLIGTAKKKAAVISFVHEKVHALDIGTIIDQQGIAVRTGHHCAQPVMQHFGVAATARASFGLYNTREEIDALVAGLHRVLEFCL